MCPCTCVCTHTCSQATETPFTSVLFPHHLPFMVSGEAQVAADIHVSESSVAQGGLCGNPSLCSHTETINFHGRWKWRNGGGESLGGGVGQMWCVSLTHHSPSHVIPSLLPSLVSSSVLYKPVPMLCSHITCSVATFCLSWTASGMTLETHQASLIPAIPELEFNANVSCCLELVPSICKERGGEQPWDGFCHSLRRGCTFQEFCDWPGLPL
jgi:hypothetical protein